MIRRFRDMRVARKVLLIPVLMFCLLGPVLGVAVYDTNADAAALQRLGRDIIQPTRDATVVSERGALTHAYLLALLSRRAHESRLSAWLNDAAMVTEALGTQDAAMLALIDTLRGKVPEGTLTALHTAFAAYAASARGSIGAAFRDSASSAETLLAADAQFRAMQHIFDELLLTMRDRVTETTRTMAAHGHVTASLIVMVGALALVIALLGSILVGRGIARPIARLAKVVARLTEGDTTPRIPDVGRADEVGDIARAVEIFRRDAIAQHDADAALRRTLRQLDIALNNMTQGLCLFDSDHRLVLWNRRVLEILGLSPDVMYESAPFRAILSACAEAGMQLGASVEEVYENCLNAVRQGRASGQHITRADGRSISISRQVLPEGGWIATLEDTTEKRQDEERIIHMARHDHLTGLPNRRLFQERLELALARAARGEQFAVHCLDLDHFKQVNDTLGHDTGDAFLRLIADRLRACVREIDTVARLGGDEFAILQENIAAPENAAVLAERILGVACGAVEVAGHHVNAGTSIGIALAPRHGSSAVTLMKHADVALYAAKSERGRFMFFEPDMEIDLQNRHAMETDLRHAVSHEEFELYYQPLVCLSLDRIVSFEALIRWRHPERGMVSPADFIPLAEETGLILPIGEWVLFNACREAMTWPGDIKVAVNLSPVQFRGGRVLDMVTQALRTTGLSASRLVLEITESALMHDDESTLSLLHRLRAVGVGIAMDDFGTGYSSLGYLHKFPFDKIKIDRSFVSEMTRQEGGVSVVRAITTMSQNLGMATVAEGVETEEQLSLLRQEGCTEVQGYLFSPPVPAAQVMTLLNQMNHLAEAAD